MPKTVTEYSVFIASPADVLNERRIVKQVIDDWNASVGQTLDIRLSPVAWETNATPRMGDTPQALINRELVSVCDILVGIFWTRIGSPTETAASGTIEEIEQFVDAKKPALIYFSSIPIDPNKIDADQHKKLEEFKYSARKNGLIGEFSSTEELRAKLQANLTRCVDRLQKAAIETQNELPEVIPVNEEVEEAKDYRNERNANKIPFESLSSKDRVFWQARATNYLMDGGATTIPTLAINSCAKGLYGESIKTTEDLRQEFLSGQRAAMRRDRTPESVKKAASRLPKEGFK